MHNITTRTLLLIVTISLSIIFSSVSAEESVSETCAFCGSRGFVTCKVHNEEWVKPKYRSSALIESKCGCCGLGWMPCPKKKCPKKAESVKKFEEETAPLFAWLEGRRAEVDKKLFSKDAKLSKIKALHAETDHYLLSGTFKARTVKYLYKGMVKKKKYTPEESLHLYAERIEDGLAIALKMLKYEGDYRPKFTPKWLLMIWSDEKEQEVASFETCHFTNTAGAKIDGVCYTTWDSDDDEYLHHKMVNALTSLLIDDHGGVVEYFPDWIREATGHWVEYEIFQELRIFTGSEGGFDNNCPTFKLKSAIRKAVDTERKDLSPFNDIINKKMGNITGWERLKCWSIIDWMVNSFKEDKLGQLIVSLKQEYHKAKQQGPSFRTVFSMTPDEIDDEWKAWVLETYPKREE